MPINIPASLTLVSSAFALDGGSVFLMFVDASGAQHSLHVPQHGLPDNFRPEQPPGALVFDGEVLPVRGDGEAALLSALRMATIEPRFRRGKSPHGRIAPKNRRIVIGDELKERFAAMDAGPEAALRYSLDKVIAFIESAEFVEVARRHGRVP